MLVVWVSGVLDALEHFCISQTLAIIECEPGAGESTLASIIFLEERAEPGIHQNKYTREKGEDDAEAFHVWLVGNWIALCKERVEVLK